MSTDICLTYLEQHAPRALRHYAHAIEKHPYFCDWDPLQTTDYFKKKMTEALRRAREDLKFAAEANEVEWIEVLECEKFEAVEALASGDKAHAVEDLYDMIAVCLRTIDVLEGRQKLGKQEEVKERHCS